MKRSVPGCEPRVTVPRGAAFWMRLAPSRISISFEDDTVSPITCTSRTLPTGLISREVTQVLSGSRREISSMNASAG